LSEKKEHAICVYRKSGRDEDVSRGRTDFVGPSMVLGKGTNSN